MNNQKTLHEEIIDSNINNFRPCKYWKFQAPVIEYNATSFEVEEISGF